MGLEFGQGYFGSPNKETTLVADEEILQKYLPPITRGGVLNAYKGAYKISLKVYQDCHVEINGGDPIFLEADTIFNTDIYDLTITSIVIVEPNTQFVIFGAH